MVKILGGVLAAAAVLWSAAAGAAGPAPRKVRVLFYNDPGYCDNGHDGTVTGLVPDWVGRLSERLGWQVEWVKATYEESFGMLAAGEVDVMGGVVNRLERHRIMNFTHHPMGIWRVSLYVLQSSDVTPSNLRALDGKTVGAVLGYAQNDVALSYLAANGANCTLREFPDATAMERALVTGEVGAVLSDVAPGLAGERVITTFPSVPLYFVTAIGRPALAADIDEAMVAIVNEDPFIVRRLRSTYFPEERRADLAFSAEERAWIDECAREQRKFTVDITPEEPSFKFFDYGSGRVGGAVGVMIEELSALTGLEFVPLPPTGSVRTSAERFVRHETDVWMPSDGQTALAAVSEGAERLSFRIPQACVTRRFGAGSDFTDPSSRIAVWRGDHQRLLAYRRLGFTQRTVVCETREECLRAVVDGMADCSLMIYPVARDLVSQMRLHDKVDLRLVELVRYEPTFPVLVAPGADPRLVSVLRKAMRSLTRDRVVDLVHRAEGRMTPAPALTREEALQVGAVVALAVLAVITLVMYLSRRRIMAALTQAEKSLIVADDSLNEAVAARAEAAAAAEKAEFEAKSKANFLATMSHEIRTPLNAVIGFAEFLSAPGVDGAKAREYAMGISHSAGALLSLVNDVLDISKFDSGRTEAFDIRRGRCDVTALCAEMRSVFSQRAAGKGVELRFIFSPAIPALALSEPRVRQIMLNLIGNAVKFTDHGRVEVSVAYDDGVFRLKVSDTGIGITPRGLKFIFDPFSQDMDSRCGKAYAGTGLGLTIVKRLVEASGGEVEVASELGRGSEFTVVVPGVALAAAPAAAPAARAASACFAHVAVVDDVALNRRILEMYCQSLGVARTEAFAGGAEAIAYLEKGGEVDLVLSDLWMPGMDGSELARRIAALRPGLPVVAVTADTDAGASFDVNAFRDILTKPVTSAKLRELFARLSGS